MTSRHDLLLNSRGRYDDEAAHQVANGEKPRTVRSLDEGLRSSPRGIQRSRQAALQELLENRFIHARPTNMIGTDATASEASESGHVRELRQAGTSVTCAVDGRNTSMIIILVSVAEPDLMASDSTRVLMRQLLGAVAQYDKSQIVAKLRGARMRKRAQQGRCEGRKPFGFFP
jgi:hypothetical protein